MIQDPIEIFKYLTDDFVNALIAAVIVAIFAMIFSRF